MNLSRKSEDKVAKSMHGTTRQLIFNAIEGVTNGFQSTLKLLELVLMSNLRAIG